MYPSNDGTPTPISGALGDILDAGAGNELPIMTQIAHNMGNRTFLFHLPMKVFYERSVVANERGKDGETVAQRPLNLPHATKLAKFMLKGLVHAAKFKRELEGHTPLESLNELESLLGKQPYVSMQPLVCNLRDVDPKLANLRGERILSEVAKETVGFKVWLPQTQLLYVVDGQHRRKAMQLLFEFLNNAISSHTLTSKGNLLTPLTGELSNEMVVALQALQQVANAFATVQIECHLGLDVDQERQLFHDLNNLGKKVESSLALQFDNSNPVNVFIKESLMDDDTLFDWPVIEKDIIDWQEDQGSITRKDLVSINARLFLNKTNISGASPAQVDPKKESVILFWEAITKIPHLGQPGAKIKTAAAQPVVLKALAKLAYDFGFGKKADDDLFKKLISEIPNIDFGHDNPMWRFYQLSSEEKAQMGLSSLEAYLPTDDEGYNRDIGNYDATANTMRFGAKHNDIFPIIGDMIRWKLSLPSRKK
ncbi:DNA sulfur modification protein DndB [Vibrio maritimus]|uniref:DNA sulfur modification protein DndB n=1 Tax=Vibrio maritimus TaxID=990268 RepID=UPI004067D469